MKDKENEIIEFKYKYEFPDGRVKGFNIRLDGETLNIINDRKEVYPDWTELPNFKCPNCPLTDGELKYCPVITNLLDVISYFKDSLSYEEVNVVLDTNERSYMKKTSLQSGLNPLVGIYMVSSGCPVLEKLKPMVRFHLPFASLEETNYRMISMYLCAQFFIYKNNGTPDWDLNDLVKIYEDIRIVNKNFCNRLSALKFKDAAINALITLDCFAFSVSYSIDVGNLQKISKLFKGYLTD